MSLAEQQAQYYRDPDTGFLMMPGTKRPDGTFRKPRRIKEGYVPQDEVPLYESKGKQLAKARETGPAIPGLPSGGTGGGIFNMKIDTFDHKALLGPPKIPGLHPEDSAQMALTNLDNGDAPASKKSNKKKKKSAGNNSGSGSSPAVKQVDQEYHDNTVTTQYNQVNFSSNQNSSADSSAAVDPAKKLRNLKKKLRDIETLEKKLNDGTLANPEPEQLEKVRRKVVMLEELAELEAMVANMST